jgi:hypothetical protein
MKKQFCLATVALLLGLGYAEAEFIPNKDAICPDFNVATFADAQKQAGKIVKVGIDKEFVRIVVQGVTALYGPAPKAIDASPLVVITRVEGDPNVKIAFFDDGECYIISATVPMEKFIAMFGKSAELPSEPPTIADMGNPTSASPL